MFYNFKLKNLPILKVKTLVAKKIKFISMLGLFSIALHMGPEFCKYDNLSYKIRTQDN